MELEELMEELEEDELEAAKEQLCWLINACKVVLPFESIVISELTKQQP